MTSSDPTPPDHLQRRPERDPTVQDGLHPVVYGTIVALALWFVVSVWALFGSVDYDGITLVS